ncbi:MAG: inositol phosphorylceramide synthase [Sphingobacteriaceae bacterium]|nr:MAG: inositol phosphorylceramide synthase [Sphingobacteriaceae bacterium]
MDATVDTKSAISLKTILTISLLSIGYLILSYFIVGFKSDQLVLIAIFNTAYYSSLITRKFILGFSVFAVYWIIFDYMKAVPNYEFSTVHIADLYNFEKKLFGINFNGQLLTPNEYWAINGNTIMDIIGGLFYLCWIPVPLGFATYLFFKNRKEFLGFAITFFVVNLVGFVGYYTFPAAPPWYVHEHGFIFDPATKADIGGLVKFDQFFNVHIFKDIYSKGSNVFAAMPSLHSAYPIIVVYYGIRNKLGYANIILATVMVGIWFTAVYTSHHYMLDVIAGIICALIGIGLFNLLSTKIKFFKNTLHKYVLLIQ